MKKKEILIVAHHLTVGGVQKSLLSALKAIDYDKYKVTLYLRKNRLDLAPLVDEHVELVVNEDKQHYYRRPLSLVLQLGILTCKLIHYRKGVERLERKLADSIRKAMMQYEKKTYFDDITYDVAISYVQGYTTEFVADYVKADKKYVFYQVSTDELHEVHEKSFPKFDKIVVEHEDIKNLMAEWYPAEAKKIEIVENYVDYDVIRTQSCAYEVNKDGEKTCICSCGRFAKVKGFDLAVEAANILKNRGKEFVWYLVGDGPERYNVEQLISKYELADCVKLTGMLTNPYPYIANADIYVQPSYEEALSLALLEAQILCVPIVTTKTVGGTTMVKAGINGLCASVSANGVADGIQTLMENCFLREKLKENLEAVDYLLERNRYKNSWNKLLEE